MDYLERETIYLICNNLGIEMPDRFKDFETRMNSIWPTTGRAK